MKSGNRLPVVVAAVAVLAVVGGTVFLRGQGGPEHLGEEAVQGGQEQTASPLVQPSPTAGSGAVGVPSAKAGLSMDAQEQMAGHVERRAEMREQQAERNRELRERSQARYASEQVDPAWAPGKESELTGISNREAFAQAGAKPTSLSVDCRSSMCRLDGQFETRSQAEDWIMMYMSSVGNGMPNSIVSRSRNPDGSTRVEIYGRAR